MYNNTPQACNNCKNQIELVSAFRRVWTQHVWWTRYYIISLVNKLNHQELIYYRILRNASDLIQILSPYYSEEQLLKLKELFESFIRNESRVIQNKIAGNSYATNVERRNWYQISDEIAEYLYQMNPLLTPSITKNLLYSYIEMTESEVENMMTGQNEKEILLFDMIESGVYSLADFMSSGIISQFHINN